MNSKRLLGVDFGHARTGLSVSDPSCIIASPLAVIPGSKDLALAARLVAAEIQKKGLCIREVIVGLPIHLNGTESERSCEVRTFAKNLEALLDGVPVRLFDERLTSVQADRAMKADFRSRKQRAKAADSVASIILLQTYLDSLQHDTSSHPCT